MNGFVNSFIRTKNGVTLIALVITIILLLVLAGISISAITGNNSLIRKAGLSKVETETSKEIEILEHASVRAMELSTNGDVEKQNLDTVLAKNSEIDGTKSVEGGVEVKFKSGREYFVDANGTVETIDVTPGDPIQIGDYIKYDVEYKDIWNDSLYFSSTNGWRVLNYTDNGNGSYSNVELISTGRPAALRYVASTYEIQNNSWWVLDNNKLNDFRNVLTNNGQDEYNFYSEDNGPNYRNLQAAAGLYYNFGDIQYRYGTSGGSNYNQGFYKYIKNKENIYNDTVNVVDQNGNEKLSTGSELFKVGNVNVRTLTLPEINKKLNRNDVDSIDSITNEIDPKGLFSIVNSGFDFNTGAYYIASPYYSNNSLGYWSLLFIGQSGSITQHYNADRGVRPVISFKSNRMKFKKVQDGNYLEIK